MIFSVSVTAPRAYDVAVAPRSVQTSVVIAVVVSAVSTTEEQTKKGTDKKSETLSYTGSSPTAYHRPYRAHCWVRIGRDKNSMTRDE
jgi:hypothetical protein